jgi:hypothetical protein
MPAIVPAEIATVKVILMRVETVQSAIAGRHIVLIDTLCVAHAFASFC